MKSATMYARENSLSSFWGWVLGWSTWKEPHCTSCSYPPAHAPHTGKRLSRQALSCLCKLCAPLPHSAPGGSAAMRRCGYLGR